MTATARRTPLIKNWRAKAVESIWSAYGWMGNNFVPALRDDRTEPLVLLRLKNFAELAK